MTKLLSPAEVADELGVKLRTLYAWKLRGEGPAYTKVGRLLRYSRQAVDAYKRAGTDTRAA